MNLRRAHRRRERRKGFAQGTKATYVQSTYIIHHIRVRASESIPPPTIHDLITSSSLLARPVRRAVPCGAVFKGAQARVLPEAPGGVAGGRELEQRAGGGVEGRRGCAPAETAEVPGGCREQVRVSPCSTSTRCMNVYAWNVAKLRMHSISRLILSSMSMAANNTHVLGEGFGGYICSCQREKL